MEINTGGLKKVALLFKGGEKMSRTVKEHRATSGYGIFEDGATSCRLVKYVASPVEA